IDFQAPADAARVGQIGNPGGAGARSSVVLSSVAAKLVNVTGRTQLRISFSTPTNNDNLNNFSAFYSGENSNAAFRPRLVIRYSLPQPPPPPPPGETWQPRPGTSWQWQLTGAIDTSINAQVYDIDLFDAPQSVIDELHLRGSKVICYFSAGTFEDWRLDAQSFPQAVRGKKLDEWEGEQWLDIRNIAVLGPIISARLDLAAQKKCDAIEPDNIDGYSNSTGFPLTGNDQLVYNRWLAQQAHARKLSIALKNDLGQVKDLVNDFDFAINEQCFQYNECDALLPFVQANKAVFGVEYKGKTAAFCPKANALNFDWLLKHLNLDAYRVSCR
ncbi:MAG TPA: endo alpha-1,4 polygalactosaminidase, partial [Thermodesulfobacteriota bacterium]|nr:endo alpha-1,4 polygalactosaminidase [Thermodesulfobacteriota bacterium]